MIACRREALALLPRSLQEVSLEDHHCGQQDDDGALCEYSLVLHEGVAMCVLGVRVVVVFSSCERSRKRPGDCGRDR